jgi:DNA-binding GntR family transcriptional regulator
MMLLNREFHRLIARPAHNTVLAEILLKLHERSLRPWFISLAAPDHQGNQPPRRRGCRERDARPHRFVSAQRPA